MVSCAPPVFPYAAELEKKKLTFDVLAGGIPKATNWAAGFFVIGSAASFEYCQYLRRCERRDMKRHIEVVNDSRKKQAKKLAEEKWEQKRQEEERLKASQKPWYKFW